MLRSGRPARPHHRGNCRQAMGLSLASETHCGEIELLFRPLSGGQPGDCSPDANRFAVHEQRLDRKMRQDRREQHGDCVRLGAESQWRTGDSNTMSGRCVCHDRFRSSQSTSARPAVEVWLKASICSIEVSPSATRSTCGLPPESCQAIGRRPPCVGPICQQGLVGVSNGIRTRDILDHNQVLYQLSYTHHAPPRATDKQ